MAPGGWEALAEWYDAKQGDTGDPWHRQLIDPALLELVGDPRGTALLDLGCGNGYLARRFARAGAHVTAVDASAPIVEQARAREAAEPLGIDYRVGDAASLAFLGSGRFDLVVANMVLMNFEDAAAAIGEVGRVVRDRGRFVFSISHPCFDVYSRSAWIVESRDGASVVARRVEGYREPFADDVPWSLAPGRTGYTRGYHRPLAWYLRALGRAHLLVEDGLEPAPTEELVRTGPPSAYLAQIPLHLVIAARKIAPV